MSTQPFERKIPSAPAASAVRIKVPIFPGSVTFSRTTKKGELP